MESLPLALTLGLGALVGVAHSQAIIGDGTVILGVGAAGFLNIPYAATGGDVNLPADDPADPTNLFSPTIGLRNAAGTITALEKGTPSEGWGCGVRNGGFGSDFLDECAAESDFDGLVDGSLFNVQVMSFDADDEFLDADSSVLCGASELLYVRHQFRPASGRPGCSGAYEIKVTIENRACDPVADVIYRRVLDWDIDPTPFSELLTIAGVGVDPFFEFVTNDGFCSPRPSDVCNNDFGFDGNDVVDFGPFDQGATFQINVGQLEFGERAIFRMFYGFFDTEAQALQCVDGGNMNLFSLGQDENQENTFLFGFRRSLSKSIVNSDSFECVAAASGATTAPLETSFEVADDALGELTAPGSPPPDVAFASVSLDDTPTDDGSDGLPTEEEKRTKQGAPIAPATNATAPAPPASNATAA